MKRDWKLLIDEVEKKVGDSIHVQKDLDKIVEILKKHHWSFNSLSPEAKDRIALFAGFQCWADFQEALRGDDDGESNYESD